MDSYDRTFDYSTSDDLDFAREINGIMYTD